MVPKELQYSDEHKWIKVNGNKAIIGITDFAQEELGEIVFVELPEVGDEIEVEEPFGSLESEKTVSELYAPLSGTVTAINEGLSNSPELLNKSPYEKGWMIEIELEDALQLENLLTVEAYEELIQE